MFAVLADHLIAVELEIVRAPFVADRRKDFRVMQDWLGHANVQNKVRYTALRKAARPRRKATRSLAPRWPGARCQRRIKRVMASTQPRIGRGNTWSTFG